MTEKFSSIRHFTKEEAAEVWKSVFDHPDLSNALQKLNLGLSSEAWKEECKNYKPHYDFQKATLGRFLKICSDKSTTEVIYSGLENIQTDKSYLFIANHRDIIMDSAYQQLYFFDHNINTTKIAIGDNLVSTPLLLNIAKLNKMFLVKRGGSIREKILNSKELSEYIHHGMAEEHESVWIAQRNGRTKNGIDLTQQGLIKMLTYYNEERDLQEVLQEMHITPVTISYEYEPCDNLKARELALSENDKYIKKPGEDFNSICQGIFGFKGRVHFVIGKPIDDEIAQITPTLRKNDKLAAVCKIIDQQIYANYKLYPTNYIAYDVQENSNEFAHFYTEQQKQDFLQYIEKQSVTEDVEQEKMKNYLFQIYANPVKTHYGKELNAQEDKNW